MIIARPSSLHDLDPVITERNYVLTPYAVPFNRFSGVWSFAERAWIDIPNSGELFRMNNYQSDIDCAMHIAHHQFFWEKRSENELNDVTWQRGVYTHHVTAQLTDEQTISDF